MTPFIRAGEGHVFNTDHVVLIEKSVNSVTFTLAGGRMFRGEDRDGKIWERICRNADLGGDIDWKEVFN